MCSLTPRVAPSTERHQSVAQLFARSDEPLVVWPMQQLEHRHDVLVVSRRRLVPLLAHPNRRELGPERGAAVVAAAKGVLRVPDGRDKRRLRLTPGLKLDARLG